MLCQSEIFKALERAKLMVGSRKESGYSRCGRTDKGVSASGQVAAEHKKSCLLNKYFIASDYRSDYCVTWESQINLT